MQQVSMSSLVFRFQGSSNNVDRPSSPPPSKRIYSPSAPSFPTEDNYPPDGRALYSGDNKSPWIRTKVDFRPDQESNVGPGPWCQSPQSNSYQSTSQVRQIVFNDERFGNYIDTGGTDRCEHVNQRPQIMDRDDRRGDGLIKYPDVNDYRSSSNRKNLPVASLMEPLVRPPVSVQSERFGGPTHLREWSNRSGRPNGPPNWSDKPQDLVRNENPSRIQVWTEKITQQQQHCLLVSGRGPGRNIPEGPGRNIPEGQGRNIPEGPGRNISEGPGRNIPDQVDRSREEMKWKNRTDIPSSEDWNLKSNMQTNEWTNLSQREFAYPEHNRPREFSEPPWTNQPRPDLNANRSYSHEKEEFNQRGRLMEERNNRNRFMEVGDRNKFIETEDRRPENRFTETGERNIGNRFAETGERNLGNRFAETGQRNLGNRFTGTGERNVGNMLTETRERNPRNWFTETGERKLGNRSMDKEERNLGNRFMETGERSFGNRSTEREERCFGDRLSKMKDRSLGTKFTQSGERRLQEQNFTRNLPSLFDVSPLIDFGRKRERSPEKQTVWSRLDISRTRDISGSRNKIPRIEDKLTSGTGRGAPFVKKQLSGPQVPSPSTNLLYRGDINKPAEDKDLAVITAFLKENPFKVFFICRFSRSAFLPKDVIEIQEKLIGELYSMAQSKDIEGVPQLRFKSIEMVNKSRIAVECFDAATAKWLLHWSPKQTRLGLVCILPNDPFMLGVISFLVRGHFDVSLEEVKTMLAAQNLGLEVFNWTNGRMRRTKRGRTFFFRVDGHTLRYLNENKFELFFGMQKVYVKRVKTNFVYNNYALAPYY